MKRKLFGIAGALAALLALGLVLAGCDADSSSAGDQNFGVGDRFGIYYYVGEGFGTPPPHQTVLYGETIILPGQGTMVAPEGQYFRGWRVHYSSYGTLYEEGSSYTVNEPGNFYAIWSSYYTVTYDVNGGSDTPPSPLKVKQGGQTIILPRQGSMTAPEGRAFSGWRTTDSSSGTLYRGGSEYTVNNSVTFYAQWENKGVFIGLISFAGNTTNLITESTGVPNFSYLDSSGKTSIQNRLNSSYSKASQAGTALYYAVHKALANLKAVESALPEDIHSVNLITFTDGLDNGSFGASNTNPVEGKSGVSSTEYAAYVKEQIGSRKIGGKTINAYSIGVKGSDVTDEDAFNTTLSSIASGETKVHSLNDFNGLEEALNDIAASIEVNMETTPNFTMVTTGNDPGTIIRMTFDVFDTTPEAAAAAARYIDGTLAYDSGTGKYSLTNIQYSAGITSESGTDIVGTVSGSEVSFRFNNISGFNPDRAKQWIKRSSSSSWQINSEYSASGAISTTIDVDTTLIYLVLDASTSLSDIQITQIRTAVNTFITTLYNRTHPTQ